MYYLKPDKKIDKNQTEKTIKTRPKKTIKKPCHALRNGKIWLTIMHRTGSSKLPLQ